MAKKQKITYLSEDEEKDSKEKIKKLREKLKTCQKEKEEYLTQAQRARADLINFRRRHEAALDELRKYGQVTLIKELLPILDSLRAGSKNNSDIKQIKEQIESVLRNYNLEEIKAVGEKFNPELHEAIEEVESEDEPGTIVKVIQNGYRMGNLVLRPSKVIIAK
jgi:molecular chaperone GrpE